MPSSKSGAPGNPVPPADPVEPQDADDANPGTVEQVKVFQQEHQTGKYGSAPVKPFTPDEETDDPDSTAKKSWIEIVLVDEDGKPVPGEAYAITLPDKSIAFGTLDENGFAREEGFDPGTCKVAFTNLDQDAWEPK